MKKSSALVVLLAASLSQAAGNMEVENFGIVNSNFMAISTDCTKAYYSPGYFKVIPEKTSVMAINKTEVKGADVTVIPKIIVNMHLVPDEVYKPGFLPEAKCNPTPTVLENYPDILKVLRGSSIESSDLNFVEAKWGVNNSINAKFEISALESNFEGVKNKFSRAFLGATIKTYQVKPEVQMELSVGHDALSQFVENHFVESVCRSEEKCWFGAFGVKIGCSTSHHCDQIPRVAQVFKSMALNSMIKVKVHSAIGVPEYKVNQAFEELVSKFLMSTFQATSVKILGDLTLVTPGRFTKEYKDFYTDEVSTMMVVEQKLLQEFKVSGVEEILPKVRQVIDSKQIQCLRKFAKKNLKIEINNPCFKMRTL